MNSKVLVGSFLIVVGSLLSGGVGGQMAASYQQPARFEQLEQSVVKVQYENSYGSGVLVAPNKVLTAKHVVDADPKASPAIVFLGGRVATVKSIERSPNVDVAVITLNDAQPLKIVAKWTCRPPELNTDLLAIGHPLEISWGAFRLTLSGLTMNTPNLPKASMVVQGPSNPGLSGGPAFNSDGEVVGLVTHNVRAEGQPSTGLGLILPLAAFCVEGKPWFGSAS